MTKQIKHKRALVRERYTEILDSLPQGLDKEEIAICAILIFISTDDISSNPWVAKLVKNFIKFFPKELRAKPTECFRAVHSLDRVLNETDNGRKQGFFSASSDFGSTKTVLDEIFYTDGSQAIISVDHEKALFAIDIPRFIKNTNVLLLLRLLKVKFKGTRCSRYMTPTAYLKKRIRNEQEQILVFKPKTQMYHLDKVCQFTE